jgi:hypothetical protein
MAVARDDELEALLAADLTDRLDVLASTFGRAFVNEPMMLWPMGLGLPDP